MSDQDLPPPPPPPPPRLTRPDPETPAASPASPKRRSLAPSIRDVPVEDAKVRDAFLKISTILQHNLMVLTIAHLCRLLGVILHRDIDARKDRTQVLRWLDDFGKPIGIVSHRVPQFLPRKIDFFGFAEAQIIHNRGEVPSRKDATPSFLWVHRTESVAPYGLPFCDLLDDSGTWRDGNRNFLRESPSLRMWQPLTLLLHETSIAILCEHDPGYFAYAFDPAWAVPGPTRLQIATKLSKSWDRPGPLVGYVAASELFVNHQARHPDALPERMVMIRENDPAARDPKSGTCYHLIDHITASHHRLDKEVEWGLTLGPKGFGLRRGFSADAFERTLTSELALKSFLGSELGRQGQEAVEYQNTLRGHHLFYRHEPLFPRGKEPRSAPTRNRPKG